MSRRAQARVLWIDDDVDPTGAVMLMALEGLDVDCETSGVAGLQRALTGAYDGIILDLRMPDINGQVVLERLVTHGVSTPILVLSGFADLESGVAAMKAGARDVRHKPVFCDELADIMKALIARYPSDRRSVLQSPDGPTAEAAPLQQAARALLSRDLSRLEFVRLAEQFHRMAASEEERGRRHRAPMPTVRTRNLNEQAETILCQIEIELAKHRLPLEAEIADACGMTVEDVTQVLFAATSCQYRHCRRAVRLRPAFAVVALGAEQIAQIAYRTGYEHHGQFDRDFSETFGISPTAMRKLCG